MASLKELREQNRLRLLAAIQRAGTADRAELVRDTGFSRATVSALVGECLSRGLVMEEDPPPDDAARGRRSARLRVNVSAGGALGVDFGHGHVRVALADLTASVLAERRVDLDVDAGPGAALDAGAALVSEVLSAARFSRDRVLGVGMGLPGPIDRQTGTMGPSSILAKWSGVAPAEELSRRLELPVRLENDANLGALGEFLYGAGREAGDMVYVKVSSGVGAGLVLDGSLHTGASGIAGELGHVVVVPDGVLCRCGNRGCLETVASSVALKRRVRDAHGPALTTRRLVQLVAGGDPDATRAVQDAGRFVGGALAALCTALNPGAIVVGGDLGAACEELLDAIRAALREVTMPSVGAVPVRAAILGDRAEALGAIGLALGESEWLARLGLVALNERLPLRTPPREAPAVRQLTA